MKYFDVKATEVAIELGIRSANGWDIHPKALRAEFGFSRATAYRWWKCLREVQDKLAPQQKAQRKAA